MPERVPRTRWFRLRVALAAGVLALLVLELAWRRSWPIAAVQALLILGIVATVPLDLVALRRQRAGGAGGR